MCKKYEKRSCFGNLSVASNNCDSDKFWHIWNKQTKENVNLPDMN